MKINLKNERIKRKFFRRLREAEGMAKATIKYIEKSILLYEDFTRQADFSKFSVEKAIEFKKWLQKREHQDKPISLSTYHSYLRCITKFFVWLSGEPGYKSKIIPDKIAYLKLSRKEERIATQYTPRNFPPIEYVRKLTNSIKIDSEIDLRDRALIAFTLLSGSRDMAIATLPIGCFDEDTLIIDQNPRIGVETKFAKLISTTLIRFDETLLSYVLEWIKHLKSKGFGSQDPLFPRSKSDQGENNLSFEPARTVEPIFWKTTGRIREIFKRRSQEAGLPYFPPHTFRHTAFNLAFKSCENGEQMKAISQNFGHEHLATSLKSYANYDTTTLREIINRINFSRKKENTD